MLVFCSIDNILMCVRGFTTINRLRYYSEIRLIDFVSKRCYFHFNVLLSL